jgi:hypothetical protein
MTPLTEEQFQRKATTSDKAKKKPQKKEENQQPVTDKRKSWFPDDPNLLIAYSVCFLFLILLMAFVFPMLSSQYLR